MALVDAINEIRDRLEELDDVDRAYASSPSGVNEPGTLAIVEIADEEGYASIAGDLRKYTLKLYVIKTQVNEEQTKQDFYPVMKQVDDYFRDNNPTNADAWIMRSEVEFGGFTRGETTYYGFSKLLDIWGAL